MQSGMLIKSATVTRNVHQKLRITSYIFATISKQPKFTRKLWRILMRRVILFILDP